MIDLTTFNRYTQEQLSAMQAIYYSGKANNWQSEKYQLICSLLLTELQQFNPTAKPAAACYLHAAISACLYNKHQEEKREQDQMRANAQNAHNNLLNYDLEAKAKERK